MTNKKNGFEDRLRAAIGAALGPDVEVRMFSMTRFGALVMDLGATLEHACREAARDTLAESMARHERRHTDPAQHASECSLCAARSKGALRAADAIHAHEYVPLVVRAAVLIAAAAESEEVEQVILMAYNLRDPERRHAAMKDLGSRIATRARQAITALDLPHGATGLDRDGTRRAMRPVFELVGTALTLLCHMYNVAYGPRMAEHISLDPTPEDTNSLLLDLALGAAAGVDPEQDRARAAADGN